MSRVKFFNKNITRFIKINQRLIFGTTCFTMGVFCEMYTYNKTNDFNQSTGIGWGVLALILII